MKQHQHNLQADNADLFATVVDNGCCIGCGACAAFDPNIEIKFNRDGQYEAAKRDAALPSPDANRVCPFADGNANEDEIGADLYGGNGASDPRLGYHLASYAGWVVESDYRAKGSSGGLASWLLNELLEQNLVDHVVHVAPVAGNHGHPLFHFTISSTPGEVRASAKSRYYPVEMSGVIKRILEHPGRYAVTGIPCFIKALRLASKESAVLRDRLVFTVGIVCGHLKSTAFAELFAWQCGIEPENLRAIDFRTKLSDRPASSYAVTVSGLKDGQPESITKPTSELIGSNWGHGFFKYKACDFCDDVVGETADISIGDAWLPEYERDSRGTNVVIVRSPQLQTLLSAASADGRLHLDSISSAKAAESQAGGFRHRRDGLAYRLQLEEQAGRWRPAKRVTPSNSHLTPKLREIYRLRYELGQASHAAFAEAKAKHQFDAFVHAMNPLTARYDRHYQRPIMMRILGKLKRMLVALFQKQ
jgi:coenzyme F420 hydrogenase subunit beta